MAAYIPAGLAPASPCPSEEKEFDQDEFDQDDSFLADKEQGAVELQSTRSMSMPPHNDNGDNGRPYDDGSISTEATPFITTGPASPTTSSTAADDDEEDPRDRLRWPVILYSFSIAFLVEVSLSICWPAWNALLERGICAELYPDLAAAGLLVAGDGLDPRCKEADVQGRLAMYRGWSYTVDALPSRFLCCFLTGSSAVCEKGSWALTDDFGVML